MLPKAVRGGYKMRIRPKLPRQPEWSLPFEGWAKKFIAENMWRCEGDQSTYHARKDKFQDLMQDAYITFRHVLASYPLITEPAHIMSLFQRTMINEYHDKAKYKQRKYRAEISLEYLLDEDLKLIDTLGEESNEGYLKVLLSELPPEVRAVLKVFNDPEKLALLRQKKVQPEHARIAGMPFKQMNELNALNDLLCRLIKVPKSTDLLGMLKAALG
jgi:hypothetical protein